VKRAEVAMMRFSPIVLAGVMALSAIGGRADAQAPAAAKAPSVTIPAGTVVNVRLTQGIDVDVAQTGAMFKAIVDDPVIVDGNIAIPREARAIIQAVSASQAGEFKGSDKLVLKLNTISFGGKTHQLATEYATIEGKGEGKKTTRKVAGGAGLGAVVGGIAGGGSGALIGGAIGAVGGAAVAASGTEHLKVPAETRLQFRVSSSIRIEP
jgi:hypothetical protein